MRAITLLEAAAKHNGNSMSKINSELILQKLSDPVKRLKDERRELAKRMTELSEKINDLEVDRNA